jgi:hypothetical protein
MNLTPWRGIRESITTDYQTLAALGTSLNMATMRAVKGGASYLELYEGDILNPALYGLVAVDQRVHAIGGSSAALRPTFARAVLKSADHRLITWMTACLLDFISAGPLAL